MFSAKQKKGTFAPRLRLKGVFSHALYVRMKVEYALLRALDIFLRAGNRYSSSAREILTDNVALIDL